jgi:hypothetical protein
MNWRTPTAQLVLILVTPFHMVAMLGMRIVELLVGDQL